MAAVGLSLAVFVSGCERAQPESVASEPVVTSGPVEPLIRYLANEGVLLSLPEGTVLIDGLFRDGLPEYPVVEGATRDSLERGLGVFGEIDLVLVTHVHRDHFHSLAVERHLIENPHAHLIASSQVADSLRVLGSDYASIEARVHPVDATPGRIEELAVAGIPVRALGIAHPPSRNEPVGHLAYVVGHESTVVHLGDLGLDSPGIETLAAGRGAAVALVPYWILDGEESVARIEQALAPGCMVGFHVALGEEDTTRAWLAQRAPEARLLTEPSTFPIADCRPVFE
jgi:L-ascorbate metabolism protein UlaG (beta-lactamase superfamily)